MKRILSAGLALALSLSFALAAATPSVAGSLRPSAPAVASGQTDVVEIGHRHRRYDRHRYHRHEFRRHHHRPHVRYHRRNDAGPIIGGLVAGAIIGGIIAGQPRHHYRGYRSAHVDWCLRRYRSYDVHSNTFQPYHGPRRLCRSPYAY
ncbi:BA14K family protein [Aquibium microcysteis]|uniref:BA14K family protein n=1 Tax=Aquibium microcysteis TaxID=675281 RepID=UPI001EF3C674|nr:BA14K family protein [Aquibium microcysteis]